MWRWNVQWNPAELWLTKTRKFFHITNSKQIAQGEFYERTTAIEHAHRNMKIVRGDRAVKLGCSDWCGLHHSTHRKGHQSKLLLLTRRAVDVISEACFTGDLWASHVGPQLDRSRSDTVMISMNYNIYATLAIFFFIPVLFSFVYELELYILYEC